MKNTQRANATNAGKAWDEEQQKREQIEKRNARAEKLVLLGAKLSAIRGGQSFLAIAGNEEN